MPLLVVFCFGSHRPFRDLGAVRSPYRRVGEFLDTDLYRTAQTGSDPVGRGILARRFAVWILPKADQTRQGKQNYSAAEVHTGFRLVFKQRKNTIGSLVRAFSYFQPSLTGQDAILAFRIHPIQSR